MKTAVMFSATILLAVIACDPVVLDPSPAPLGLVPSPAPTMTPAPTLTPTATPVANPYLTMDDLGWPTNTPTNVV